MRDEILVGYETLEQAKLAKRALVDRGVATQDHVTVAPAAKFGPLRTRSQAPNAALVGVIAGASLGAVLAVLMAFVGGVGGWGLAIVLIGITGGVGAFVGALSGLSYGQVDSTDVTEHLANEGYVVKVDLDRPGQERAAGKVLNPTRGAFLTRDSLSGEDA
jgi:hypothetical protein